LSLTTPYIISIKRLFYTLIVTQLQLSASQRK